MKYQLLAELRPEEKAALEADIEKRGVLVPVDVDEDGNILDGHNRVEIANRLGKSYKKIVRRFKTEEEKKEHVIKVNLARRHLDPMRWGLAADTLIEIRGIRTGKGRQPAKRATLALFSEELGVPYRTAKHRLALGRAYLELPEEERQIVDSGEKTLQQIRNEHRRRERTEKLVEMSEASRLDGSIGVFPILYADPPWRYEHVKTESRAIENQYPTMDLAEICALDVPEITTPDAVLFMWATSPKLAESMEVLVAWGFNYRTCMVWVKDKIGMGYYARQQHELLLIAVKGTPPTPEPANRPSSVIHAPRQEHSSKPDQFYEVIEGMYPTLPWIELFSRLPRDGWKAWGNQA